MEWDCDAEKAKRMLEFHKFVSVVQPHAKGRVFILVSESIRVQYPN